MTSKNCSFWLVVTVVACTPDGGAPVGTNASASGGGAPPSSAGPPDAPPAQAKSAGPMPLRRLGKTELRNTLADLLPALPAGFDSGIELPGDNDVLQAFALPGTISDLEVRRLIDLGEAALGGLGANQPAARISCPGGDETTCARTFVTGFGKRAFRRPLDRLEVDDLMALYTKLRTDPQMQYGFKEALGVLVEAMLQSPGFLYRWERGLAAPQADGALVKLDPYEVASRLSYFIWASMPDDGLMAAADAHELGKADEIAAQAERLLRDPRADATLASFISQWLELGPLPTLIKDGTTYPDFNPELRVSMESETLAVARDVLRSPAPSLVNLLTAGYTIADERLASYYGLPAPGMGGRMSLEGTGRLGLLTQASVLAVKGNSYRTSPVRRGKLILNRLLCSDVPPPPPNLVPELPPPDPALSLREQMAEHRKNPACATCHETMDALGFAFEHFDGAGKYRDRDGTQAIDASGSVVLDGMAVAFTDAADLIRRLASSPEVQRCFVKQWLRFALGRFEQDADSPALTALEPGYRASGLDTRDLIVRIARSLSFTHRAPADGEVLAP